MKDELNYYYDLLFKRLRELKLRLSGVNRAFYCQCEIEGDYKCKHQCDHCREYFKPLEDNLK